MLTLLADPSAAGTVPPGVTPPATVLVSGAPGGTRARGDTLRAAVTPSCREVVFQSDAEELAPGDANGSFDLFVRDLGLGTTRLITANRAGTGTGNGGSSEPALSASGRFVLFTSGADDLVEGDANGRTDVFLHDLKRRLTRLVSVNQAGTASGNDSSLAEPAIVGTTPRRVSGTGRYVLFDSKASDLTGLADTNGANDVFVRDMGTQTTMLVSVDRQGNGSGNGVSMAAAISADGRRVVFTSAADDLVEGDGNGTVDVFVRDLRSGTTELVSVKADGSGSGNGYSENAVIGYNGRFVVFSSGADDLVPGDGNGATDLFVRDLDRGATTLVSVNAAGSDGGNGSSSVGQISRDGRRVVFISYAGDLVDDDGNGQADVFVRDLVRGTTELVSATPAGAAGNSESEGFEMTESGRYVLFESDATDLGDVPVGAVSGNAFLRDLKTRTTTLISIAADGQSAGDQSSSPTSIVPSTRCAAFISRATNLQPEPEYVFGYDAYVRFLR